RRGRRPPPRPRHARPVPAGRRPRTRLTREKYPALVRRKLPGSRPADLREGMGMTATTRNRLRRAGRAALAAGLLAPVAALLPAGPAHAATFVVTNLNASGAGSLVAAVADANAAA